MTDEIEMTHASQLINELDASNAASIKELAFWSGLHENTVRDYRDGRIRHFGSESRFWNGVLQGLCQKFNNCPPPVAFRVVGMLLKGTPLSAVCVPSSAQENDKPMASLFRQFAGMNRDLDDAAAAAAQIYEDGRVDARDSADIAELESKCDRIIMTAWQIKHRIGREKLATETKR